MFFQGQTLFWPYLRNSWSDWCETKRKCIGWILGTICDIDLWPHSWPWPWMFQSQILRYNSSISGIVGLIDVKWKGSELIWYWTDCITLPFDHTHELDLGVFKVRVWNNFISGMGWSIDNERKGCELSIHDHDVWLLWPWWGGQRYRIVTGVTSDVGVPSTYLVLYVLFSSCYAFTHVHYGCLYISECIVCFCIRNPDLRL